MLLKPNVLERVENPLSLIQDSVVIVRHLNDRRSHGIQALPRHRRVEVLLEGEEVTRTSNLPSDGLVQQPPERLSGRSDGRLETSMDVHRIIRESD
jgi:hypothetical protein